jgi:hypothetical protein
MADAFNRRAGKWWSELHRAAKTRADRETGRKGKLLARVWEKQARGLAHLHGVLAVETPGDVKWAQAYLTALRELAPRYGFGFVDGWEKVGRKFWPGDQAGAYLSGYFVGGGSRKAAITETVLAGDLPRLVVFIQPGFDAADGMHDAKPQKRATPLGLAESVRRAALRVSGGVVCRSGHADVAARRAVSRAVVCFCRTIRRGQVVSRCAAILPAPYYAHLEVDRGGRKRISKEEDTIQREVAASDAARSRSRRGGVGCPSCASHSSCDRPAHGHFQLERRIQDQACGRGLLRTRAGGW